MCRTCTLKTKTLRKYIVFYIVYKWHNSISSNYFWLDTVYIRLMHVEIYVQFHLLYSILLYKYTIIYPFLCWTFKLFLICCYPTVIL